MASNVKKDVGNDFQSLLVCALITGAGSSIAECDSVKAKAGKL